jgi:hypothetical protein
MNKCTSLYIMHSFFLGTFFMIGSIDGDIGNIDNDAKYLQHCISEQKMQKIRKICFV